MYVSNGAISNDLERPLPPVSRSRHSLTLKISETVRDTDIVCYAFIKMMLAACRLLLYAVYTCQKSFNFIDAFNCYKQKWKLAPFNVAILYIGLHKTFIGRQTNAVITVWTVVQTVLTATYANLQISTPTKSIGLHLNRSTKKIGTIDYIREGTSYTKFGRNPFTGGFWDS